MPCSSYATARPEMLKTVLRALCGQTLADDAYEVIVSVDGPAERVTSLVEEL